MKAKNFDLEALDRDYLFHPITNLKSHITQDVLILERGEGIYIFDKDGKKYIDLISSWWVNIHGHCRKEIVQSISKQSEKLEQVLFADFTHSPAVNLAEKLISILPSNLSRVFYSDNGSTAVEVALKMAFQYWQNRGDQKRKRFLAFEGAYHGDTVGAMSAGDPGEFGEPFRPL